MAPRLRAEYRFSWWHQGLLLYDRAYEWSSDLREITGIEMRSWLAQDASRSVTFIAPGGDLFGSTNAPLTVALHDSEPEIDPEAESVADFDLVVESGRISLEPSGGGEGLTTFELPVGQWRARWSGFGELAATEQAYPSDVLEGTERADSYRLDAWPAEAPAPVVIHRGD